MTNLMDGGGTGHSPRGGLCNVNSARMLKNDLKLMKEDNSKLHA
jgi:hypothetical protein